MLAGGSFGRRVASDYIAEVAEICGKLGGRAVKVMWTREDEFRHD
jgi:isoquinoline 1-oxidoreductase subunit beta